SSWTKSRSPVFVSDPAAERYGPGHNSFTTTADGEVVLVYHARTYTRIEGNPLYDPNRHACAQVLTFDTDGTPRWGTPLPATRPAPSSTRVLVPSGDLARPASPSQPPPIPPRSRAHRRPPALRRPRRPVRPRLPGRPAAP